MKNLKRAFKGSIRQMPLKNYKAKVAHAGFQGASFRGAFQWTVLLGVILFASLFVGKGMLQAQDRQQGWFVGVSPFVSGFEITTETSNIRTTTTKEEVSANIEITAVSNSYAGATFDTSLSGIAFISNTVSLQTWTSTPNGLSGASQDEGIEDAKTICKLGSEDESINTIYSLDVTRGKLSTFTNSYLTSLGLERNNLCKDMFTELGFGSIGDIVTTSTRDVDDAPTISSPNFSRTDSLGGYGILFGYNLEKWGVSLQYYALTEGNNRLNSVIAVANYFLPYGFSVGAGLANLALDTDLGSTSKTAPAVQFGYAYSITKNLFLEAGALWTGSSLSVEKNVVVSTTTPTYKIVYDEATNTDTKRENSLVLGLNPNNRLDANGSPDNRIEVTRTQTKTETRRGNVRSTTTNTEHRAIKVKSTNAIYIRFVLRFF